MHTHNIFYTNTRSKNTYIHTYVHTYTPAPSADTCFDTNNAHTYTHTHLHAYRQTTAESALSALTQTSTIQEDRQTERQTDRHLLNQLSLLRRRHIDHVALRVYQFRLAQSAGLRSKVVVKAAEHKNMLDPVQRVPAAVQFSVLFVHVLCVNLSVCMNVMTRTCLIQCSAFPLLSHFMYSVYIFSALVCMYA